jgi:hypothetical protein
MDELETELTTALAKIHAEHERLKAAHLIVANELSEIKTAMKVLSMTLTNSSDEMVALSHDSLGACLKLLGLLRLENNETGIDRPSIPDIEAAKAAAIHAAENVTNAANLVSYDAHDLYAYMHASRTPNI